MHDNALYMELPSRLVAQQLFADTTMSAAINVPAVLGDNRRQERNAQVAAAAQRSADGSH